MINESADYIDRRVKEATIKAETRMAETLEHYVTQSQQTLRDTRWITTAAIAGDALVLGIGAGMLLGRINH